MHVYSHPLMGLGLRGPPRCSTHEWTGVIGDSLGTRDVADWPHLGRKSKVGR